MREQDPLGMKDYSSDDPLLPSLYTYEIPVFTGVFDSTGSPIFKNNNPIGFGRDNEWRMQYIRSTSKKSSKEQPEPL